MANNSYDCVEADDEFKLYQPQTLSTPHAGFRKQGLKERGLLEAYKERPAYQQK